MLISLQTALKSVLILVDNSDVYSVSRVSSSFISLSMTSPTRSW